MFNGKISIIIPVYNVEPYLRMCLDSVVNQTYKNLEIILVDDGSTDKSGEICDEYARRDERVIVIRSDNNGQAEARNKGIDLATGEYCTFVDSDDFYASKYAIYNLVSLLDTCPDFLMYQFKRCNENADNRWDYYKKADVEAINKLGYSELIEHLAYTDMFLVSPCCKIINTSILKEKNIFFQKGIICEDIDWTFKLINECDSVIFTDQSEYVYRIRKGSTTHKNDIKTVTDLSFIVQKWANYYRDHIESSVREGMLSFISYEYYILLGLISINKFETPTAIKEMNWITGYSNSPKTKISKTICRLFGNRIAGKIFAFKMSL